MDIYGSKPQFTRARIADRGVAFRSHAQKVYLQG
jgi:hypothetical protein